MVKGIAIHKSDLLPGTLEMLILKTLDRNDEPMHGYGIALYIKQISHDVLRVEEGSLYPALQRLSVKGLINGAWRDSEIGRRARYYKLTAAGRKQLIEEVAGFEKVLEAILRVVQPA
jgi:PadR family transcriptional regulator, regulatory protein PadR